MFWPIFVTVNIQDVLL